MAEQGARIQWRMDMGAWVLVSAVIVVGVVCSVVALSMVMLREQHAVEGLEMPGEHRITLPEGGYHVLYFAFQRTQDRRGVIRPAGFERLEFVLGGPDGDAVALEPAPERFDYVSRYTRGIPAYGFFVEVPGDYVLIGEYPADFEDGQAVGMAVRQVHQNQIRDAFFAALLGLALTATLAAGISYLGMRRYEAAGETAGADGA